MTTPTTPPLPEHEKYNHDFALLIEEFLDFLGSKKIYLCYPDEKLDCFFPTRQTRMELIFEFLGVDLKAWEKENQALLEYMQRLNDIDKLNEGNK